MIYHRNKIEGARHRTWLRTWVLPRLYVGARVPSGQFLGRLLGVDSSTAGKHMRRAMVEAGIVTELRYERDGGSRAYVIEIPERRAAA